MVGADLDQIRIPGILGDSKVVVALFLQQEISLHGHLEVTSYCCYLFGRLSKDMSFRVRVSFSSRYCGRSCAHINIRYFDARTKRPAILLRLLGG